MRKAETTGGPVVLHPLHDSSAAERVAWMDRVGIDHCLVNPGGYWQQVQFVPRADWPKAIERCNTFLNEQLAGTDRLHPVALADLSDLTRPSRSSSTHAPGVRARSSSPPSTGGRRAGRSPGHPDLDPVWDAAVRLGMLAVIHVGNTESDFSGWADIGWRDDRSAGIGGLVRLANTQRTHAAQNLIAGMLYGGVFARHPDLTVMLEEMRVNWVPPFFATLERQALPSPALGDVALRRVGRRHAAPQRAVDAAPRFRRHATRSTCCRELPDQLVWSSDYPHFEGNAEPIELYGAALDELDARSAGLVHGRQHRAVLRSDR